VGSSAQPVVSPVCAFVAERTGSSLSRQQLTRLSGAIEARRNGRTDEQIIADLKSPMGQLELTELMAVLSVHKTDLFRDEVQLSAVRAHVLPPLATSKRPLRVWSAGCATGEEVATLLMMLDEAGANPASTVLGSDISSGALNEALALTFGPEIMRRVPAYQKGRYFEEGKGRWSLKKELRDRARFVRHNLMDFPYPMPPEGGAFDLIFCRNVLIYFTEVAFNRAIEGFTGRLKPGGALVLSSAEPILKGGVGLKTVRFDQSFFYVRRAPDEGPDRGVVDFRTPETPAPQLDLLARPSAPWPVVPSLPPLGERRSGPSPMPPPPASVKPAPEAEDPRTEGERLFSEVLESEAKGLGAESHESQLRRALYLAPDLAPARYLLGVMLEQRHENADAASEFRRALTMLTEGKSRPTPFFLNPERLKVACAQALERLGFRSR
jgi:chemotaxis protein methyltransferase CheR